MIRSPIARWMIGVLVFIGVLGLLRFKPWQRFDGGQAAAEKAELAREHLNVGFLPVT
jgi:hypothetical protein